MRKSILLLLVTMIAVVAVACGNGNNVGNGGDSNGGSSNGGCNGGNGGCTASADPEAQWKALYKAGATWTHKMGTMLMKVEVVSVDGNKATLKKSNKMGDADWMDATDGEAEYKEAAKVDPDPCTPKPVTGSETISAAGKDWDCDWSESEAAGKKSKSWVTKEYGYNLIIKSEYDGKVNMELVEFKAGS